MVLVYQNGKIFATKKRANTPSMAFLKKKYQNATKIWANGLTSASYWGCSPWGVLAMCHVSRLGSAGSDVKCSAELNNKKYLKLFSKVCLEKYLYNNCIYTQIFLISDSWFHSTASKSQFIRQILLNILYLHIASLQIRQNNY